MNPGFLRRFVICDDKNESIAEVTLRAPKDEEATLPLDEPYVVLDEVWTAPKARGQGLCSLLLQVAWKFADSNGWPVAVRPQAHGLRPRMTQSELVSFYVGQGCAKLKDHPDWLFLP